MRKLKYVRAITCVITVCIIGCGQTPEVAKAVKRTDYELCNDTYFRVADNYHLNGFQSLKEEQRVVLLVWAAVPIIDNGGFEYLFEHDLDGDPDFSNTLRALQTIGADAPASALRDAINMFPNGRPHSDVDERTDFYQALSEEHRMELSRRFWSHGGRGDDEITVALAKFIRAHSGSLDE